MPENHTELDKNSNSFLKFSKYTVFLLAIIGLSLLVRFYYFPFDVPLTSDALFYFWYSSDIYQIKELPNWSLTNNGWPILVSFFFSLFDSKDILTFMQIQRLLAVLFSILISVPVYFLCKKFVSKKFALIGATLIAFDPRLMINSFLGGTDPLYLLLIATSLTVFLFSNKKLVYFSFVLASFAIIIRLEGMFFFVVLSILFFVRYRKEGYPVIFRYLAVIGIFTLIVLPISIYRIEESGEIVPIFLRNPVGSNVVLSDIEKSEDIFDNIILNGLKILIQYLIWILIPTFIIFIPLGIFLIFKNRNFDKNTIILSTGIMMIPAFYAYTIPALDTRYLYVLFPMFSVLAVLAIEKFSQKLNRPNIIIIGIISAIIISSLLFYDQYKIDYEHEQEAFEIITEISPIVNGVNSLGKELRYFSTVQTIEQWPALYLEIKFDIIIIPTTDYKNLENYIINSQEEGLTHIIIDNNNERPSFLRDIFLEENNYSYLNKIYDSKMDGFNYHVKVFEIDYQSFSNMN